MTKVGVTTGNLKLRSGPGTEFEPPLAYLEPNTSLEILDEKGDWLHVKVQGREGYLGRKYVNITETKPPPPKAPPAPPQVKPAGMPDSVWEQMKKK